ncbi:thioesterase II family protein [Arenibaculum sp.]|jgi:surfactin synthase thioesterase subunit|uniref:thioesterase II family protein n=1 Tax=Arenibaculum sp. TaxID=2865862 RepID=UPI002E0FC605|nr:alpha/beta fold hydrolase [Arenibaculum sp.]
MDGPDLPDPGQDGRFWVASPREPGDPVALRLFCFPHAGAGGATFFEWGRRLPGHVQVVGVHLPGRGTRIHEAPFDSVAAIVSALSRAIGRWDDAPSVFFGHSFGGVLAYELARSLAREAPGSTPRALLMSSCPAPHVPPRRSYLLHELPRGEFFQELGRMNGLSAGAIRNDKLLDLIEPALRADIKARELWSLAARSAPPPDPLAIPIHPLCGDADPFVAPGDVAQWGAYTTDLRPAVLFEGGHFHFAAAPDRLLAVVADILDTHSGPAP